MTVDANTVAMYEHARANLWAAICKANPQLALFNSPTGTEGGIGRTVEPREMDSRLHPGAEPRCPTVDAPDRASGGPATGSPLAGGGSAPTTKECAICGRVGTRAFERRGRGVHWYCRNNNICLGRRLKGSRPSWETSAPTARSSRDGAAGAN